MLMNKDTELEQFSHQLGWEKTLFAGSDFVYLNTANKKELLQQAQRAKQKKQLVVYEAPSEEMLRFALEKTAVDIVMGMEKINPHDSLHYVRGGIDQIPCTIAAKNEKTIAFSFRDILYAEDRPRLLGRMMANIRLCRKYKVKTVFSTFAKEKWEIRSAKDLDAFWRVLGKGD